ncbi:MAG: hypothetical protein U9N87_08475, partial [Planctomycetota bacterium]|nr:hypothetical protein [Planctomycetota bacterium]
NIAGCITPAIYKIPSLFASERLCDLTLRPTSLFNKFYAEGVRNVNHCLQLGFCFPIFHKSRPADGN